MKQAYLLLGEIVKPQGIRGEVKVRHYTDDPQRFCALKNVYVKQGEAYRSLSVNAARVQNNDVFLKLDGVNDRNQAEEMRGLELWIDREHAAPLDEEQVYIADILGACAYDTKGCPIGRLTDVITTNPTPVLVFDTQNGTMMMPMLKQVVLEIDIENEKIMLDEARLNEVAFYEDSRS